MDIEEHVAVRMAKEQIEEALRAAEGMRTIGHARPRRSGRVRLGRPLARLGHCMKGQRNRVCRLTPGPAAMRVDLSSSEAVSSGSYGQCRPLLNTRIASHLRIGSLIASFPRCAQAPAASPTWKMWEPRRARPNGNTGTGGAAHAGSPCASSSGRSQTRRS